MVRPGSGRAHVGQPNRDNHAPVRVADGAHERVEERALGA